METHKFGKLVCLNYLTGELISVFHYSIKINKKKFEEIEPSKGGWGN